MPTTSYNQYIHKNGDWRLIGVGEIDPISIEHGGTGASTLAGAFYAGNTATFLLVEKIS